MAEQLGANPGHDGNDEVYTLPVDQPTSNDYDHSSLVAVDRRDRPVKVWSEDLGVYSVGNDGDLGLLDVGPEHSVLLSSVRHANAVVGVGQGILQVGNFHY